MFDLVKPCSDCPFRTDKAFYLRSGRAEEIAASLESGKTFSCHKTTMHDDDGEYAQRDKEQHCAGATIILEKIEIPNQLMRIFERVNGYDRTKLAMDSPVFECLQDWVDSMQDNDL